MVGLYGGTGDVEGGVGEVAYWRGSVVMPNDPFSRFNSVQTVW